MASTDTKGITSDSARIAITIIDIFPHGAMLFAALSSTFVFLRIINDKYNRSNNQGITRRHIFIYTLTLTVLFGLSLYIFGRLIIWGATVNSVISFDPVDKNYSSLFVYYREIGKITRESIPNYLDPFITHGNFPSFGTIFVDLLVGFISSCLLLYSLGIEFDIRGIFSDTS